MYQDFYGLTGDPFRLTPGNIQCFEHSSYARARSYLQYALHKHEGVVLLTGNPGTGKTSLVAELDKKLADSRVCLIPMTCSRQAGDDLLRLVASHLGLTVDRLSKTEVLAGIENALVELWQRQKRYPVLVLDEAQTLAAEALEQVRLLTNLNWQNHPLLQIILVGQPGLRKAVLSAGLEQLHQRVIASAAIEPLTESEIQGYVLHRMKQVGWQDKPQLADSLFPVVHRYSKGIPRWINLIFARLLLLGMVDQLQALSESELNLVLSDLIDEDLLPLEVRASSDVQPRFG